MARIIGTAGESAILRGALFIVVPIAFVFLWVVPLTAWSLGRSEGMLGALLVILAVAGTLYWFRRDLREMADAVREGTNYLKGAHGEILVHQELTKLPDEFIVFHDFHPVDLDTGKPARWNVDHIVVGSTGVFVLDAKYYKQPKVLCAAKSQHSRRNVMQVQRNAMELKDRLARWSRGDLESLFVVPVVVYAQPNAQMECLREGGVRTLPLRLLLQEIQSHSEVHIDQEKAGRIARVLHSQLGPDLKSAFKSELDAFGELSKAERYRMRDARLAQDVATPAKPKVPDKCPLCGAPLVRRTARRGARAGKQFLSCSDYPTCDYGFNLDE